MCTLHNFHRSKARFTHTSTVTGSHSSFGNKIRVRLAYILLNNCGVNAHNAVVFFCCMSKQYCCDYKALVYEDWSLIGTIQF